MSGTELQVFALIVSFNCGMLVGAGIAWGLVMYVWEPIEAEETKEDYDLM